MILLYFAAHEPGLVTLQVACEGYVISNSCVFEYKQQEKATLEEKQKEWFASDGKAAF